MLTAFRSLFFSRTTTPRAPSPEVVEYGKNPACLEAVEATNRIVFDALPTEPPINPSLREKYEIMQNAKLEWQTRYVRHEIRVGVCKELGFSVYSNKQAAELLAGVPVKQASYEHFREHEGLLSARCSDRAGDRGDIMGHEDVIGVGIARIFSIARKGVTPIIYDSFGAFEVPGNERLILGRPSELRYPISTGAILRMEVAKKINVLSNPLFNGFVIIAPESCWASPEKKDPLLLGVILGPIDRKERCFQDRFALLARWE